MRGLTWSGRPSPRHEGRGHPARPLACQVGSNLTWRVMPVHFEKFSFGSMQIDGRVYDFDLVIDRGEIRKR